MEETLGRVSNLLDKASEVLRDAAQSGSQSGSSRRSSESVAGATGTSRGVDREQGIAHVGASGTSSRGGSGSSLSDTHASTR